MKTTCEEKVKQLDLFSLEKRNLKEARCVFFQQRRGRLWRSIVLCPWWLKQHKICSTSSKEKKLNAITENEEWMLSGEAVKTPWMFTRRPEAHKLWSGTGVLDSALVQRRGLGQRFTIWAKRRYLRRWEAPENYFLPCFLLLPSPKSIFEAVGRKTNTHHLQPPFS